MVERIFKYVDEVSPWYDGTNADTIKICTSRAVVDMLKKIHTKQKLIYRLAGQSGTGKTTQLLPAILEFEQERGNNPVIIAVRSFYQYHPNFEELKKTCEPGELRERTNGFSLKCLAVAAQMIIEMGYLIILDVTILAPEFEEFITTLIQQNKYTAQYHMLAVSKQQSDAFIEKRRNDSTHSEGGKIVHRATKDYFFDILPKGLEQITKLDNKSQAIVWTAYDKQPIYDGNIVGAMSSLQNGRAWLCELKYSEKELLKAKINFLAASAK